MVFKGLTTLTDRELITNLYDPSAALAALDAPKVDRLFAWVCDLEFHEGPLALHVHVDCIQPIDLQGQPGSKGLRSGWPECDGGLAALRRLQHPGYEIDLRRGTAGDCLMLAESIQYEKCVSVRLSAICTALCANPQ